MKPPLQVIVTRPSPYGESLCHQLEQENFISQHCPLIRFAPDHSIDSDHRFQQLQQAKTWIFVSRQAVNFCFEHFNQVQQQQLIALGQNRTLIAVGRATADTLQQRGFTALTPDTPNSEGMIALLKQHQIEQQPTLLIRGNQGRQLLEQFFHDKDLCILPVYQRLQTEQQLPELAHEMAIIVTSGQLLELAAKQITAPDKTTIITGSQRISEMAQHIGFTNCYTAINASNSELVKSCILWRNNVC